METGKINKSLYEQPAVYPNYVLGNQFNQPINNPDYSSLPQLPSFQFPAHNQIFDPMMMVNMNNSNVYTQHQEGKIDHDTKGKRRSKHEQEGRNYKCQHCDKTYLSYHALYIHNKNKHKNASEQISGSSRGRGRPKKVFITQLTEGNHENNSVEANSNQKEIARKGGPTPIVYGFKESIEYVSEGKKSYKEHNLYKQILKLHIENCKNIQYKEEFKEYIHKENSQEKADIIKEEKQGKNCDEILAEFLDEQSKETNQTYYGKLLKFILMYRDFYNTNGESILNNLNHADPEIKESSPEQKENESKEEYCLNHDAEQFPEVSNEFILDYFDKTTSSDITREEAISFTQLVCNWLFGKAYTSSKLSLLEN